MKKITLTLFAAITCVPLLASAAPEKGFVQLFDGKSLNGWKVNEHPESFSIQDGAIQANGDRAHCYYVGGDKEGVYKNFVLRLDVMTRKGANGGVYFHSKFIDEGWPTSTCYEVQVNNTQSDWQKSGSLYSTVSNKEPFKDDEWMKYEITVKDDHVKVEVNGKELVDYTEEEGKGKLLEEGGLIALQAHDPGSTVLYKNIRIKPLKD